MEVIGNLRKWSEENLVGIIGPRIASQEEYDVAYWLARKCAEKGKIVVSGLANGVDTYAHRGALDGGGETIAILSTSPKEKIYPEKNKDLAEKIRKKGALIYPYEIPFWEADKVYGKIEHSKSRRILRFLERDILLAKLCPVIIAVSNKKISGGTRWAVNYGVKYEKSVHQYNRQGKQIPLNFFSAEIDWKTELNLFS